MLAYVLLLLTLVIPQESEPGWVPPEGPSLSPAPGSMENELNWSVEWNICGSGYNFFDTSRMYEDLVSHFAPLLSQKYAELYLLLDADLSELAMRLDLLKVEIDSLDNCQPYCMFRLNKQYFLDRYAQYENEVCQLLAEFTDVEDVQVILTRIDDLTASFQNRPRWQDDGFCAWWADWARKVDLLWVDCSQASSEISELLSKAKTLKTKILNETWYIQHRTCLGVADPTP